MYQDSYPGFWTVTGLGFLIGLERWMEEICSFSRAFRPSIILRLEIKDLKKIKADNIFFYCQLFGVHVCHILYSSNHIQCINSWDIAHQIVGGPPIPKNVPPANFLVYQYCVKKYMFGDSGYLCSEKANKSVLADSRSIKF